MKNKSWLIGNFKIFIANLWYLTSDISKYLLTFYFIFIAYLAKFSQLLFKIYLLLVKLCHSANSLKRRKKIKYPFPFWC